MKVTEEDGLTPALDHPLAGVPSRNLVLYLLPFVIFPVLLIAAAFFIVPTQWFILRSGNTYMANMGYAATLHNSDCKVLVYGDSTALTSVNPATIEQRTGLKTCDIAEFEGMTNVNGTILVDEFLAHNPRPRFIVFMYSPEDLRIPPTWRTVSSFEAITYRVQNYHNRATLDLLAHHPLDTLEWAEQGMRMALIHAHSHPLGADHLNIRDPSNGFLPLTGETLANCDQANHDDAPDAAWLDGLRSRYAVNGTRVIIDATPAPPCEFSLPFILKHLPQEVDDRPYPIYPVNYFLKNTRLLMNARGSHAVTNMIADQILQRMAKSLGGVPSGVQTGASAAAPATSQNASGGR